MITNSSLRSLFEEIDSYADSFYDELYELEDIDRLSYSRCGGVHNFIVIDKDTYYSKVDDGFADWLVFTIEDDERLWKVEKSSDFYRWDMPILVKMIEKNIIEYQVENLGDGYEY